MRLRVGVIFKRVERVCGERTVDVFFDGRTLGKNKSREVGSYHS
jgi:hypothetical protein